MSSSSTVDTFLSSLSELSQSRLREDEKRQRDLRRKVDELRSNSPQKYNRFDDRDSVYRRDSVRDSARDSVYGEGLLRSEPTKPTKPQHLHAPFEITLLNPTARKDDTSSEKRYLERYNRERENQERYENERENKERYQERHQRYENERYQERYENERDQERRERYQESSQGSLGDQKQYQSSQGSRDHEGYSRGSRQSSTGSSTEPSTLGSGEYKSTLAGNEAYKHAGKRKDEVDYESGFTRRFESETPEQKLQNTSHLGAISDADKQKYAAIFASRFSEPNDSGYRSFAQIDREIRGEERVPPPKPEKLRASEKLDKDTEETKPTKPSVAPNKPSIEKASKTLSQEQIEGPEKHTPPPKKVPSQPTYIEPGPLFPQRNMYYSSSSLRKGANSEKPPVPAKTHLSNENLGPNYKISSKPDWLSSSLNNKVSKESHHDGPSTPKPLGHIPKKGWLSSSMQSAEKMDNSETESPERISRSPTRGKNDWMSSLANSKIGTRSSYQHAQTPSPTKPAASISPVASPKKQTSWIDSALKKSDSHRYMETVEPSFKIVKKKTVVAPVEDKPPELLSHFERMRSAPEKPKNKPVPKPSRTSIDEPDFLGQLAKVKEKKPKVSPKSIDNTSNDEDILKQTMSKLAAAKPPKPAKKPVEIYTQEEADLLRSTMSRLSPRKPVEKKAALETFTQAEKELLSQTMSKLAPKAAPVEKPSLRKYEESDAEAVRSQMKLLGNQSVSYRQLERKEEPIEGVEKLSSLKSVKIDKKKEQKENPFQVNLKPVKKGAPKTEEPAKPEKPQKPGKPSGLTDRSESPSELGASFQNRLSMLLSRPNTMPELGSSNPTIKRTNTEPGPELTHPNKTRAKGPRRRLPKKNDMAAKENKKETYKNESKKDCDTDKAGEKAMPPKPKPKPKAFEMKNVEVQPSRSFSGEVFL